MQVELATVNTLRYDAELCTGCGMCSTVCPHGIFLMDGRKARAQHAERCIECGACQRNCPTGAITVDSGVGCATAYIMAALTGREATCGGSDGCCGGGKTGCC